MRLAAILLSPLLYAAARLILTPETNIFDYPPVYEQHAIIYFASFFVAPALLIKSLGEELRIYAGKKEFAAGFLAYMLFTPVFILLFDHALGSNDLRTLFFMALNVSAVDFYVRRVCQYPFHGSAGIVIGIIAWLVVHIPESFALLDFGAMKVIGFMTATAFLFAVIYSKTKDVAGFIAGHIALNVIVGLTL